MKKVRFLLDRSRVYTGPKDDAVYRSNVYFDMTKMMAVQAREYGYRTKQDMEQCYLAETAEDARFFAYFSGANARKAFTAASLVLEMQARYHLLTGREFPWHNV